MGEQGKAPAIEKVIIMGASGRDFHNFNVYFRDNPRYRVVAFTAAQIPVAEGRLYPPGLSGCLYPEGIPIYPEARLGRLIRESSVDLVVFSYSDIAYTDLMHQASLATTEGADFILLGASYTMLRSRKPVVPYAPCGPAPGNHHTSRKVCAIIRERLGKTVVVVRHPMPYGDLTAQTVQRFASYEDLERHRCTIEEREEYEPLIDNGIVVYAGVDYGLILERAEEEADVIVWDGGTTTRLFTIPTYTSCSSTRTGPATSFRITPARTTCAWPTSRSSTKWIPPYGTMSSGCGRTSALCAGGGIVLAESPITVAHPEPITGNRVLVVEDGPTLTHGGMSYGAGLRRGLEYGAGEMVDPRPLPWGVSKTLRPTRTWVRSCPRWGTAPPRSGTSKRPSTARSATS